MKLAVELTPQWLARWHEWVRYAIRRRIAERWHVELPPEPEKRWFPKAGPGSGHRRVK